MEENCQTYPRKVQGQDEYKVGRKYNEEVPRRILRNDVQNQPNLEARRLRTFR
jgi:hypothetical protein